MRQGRLERTLDRSANQAAPALLCSLFHIPVRKRLHNLHCPFLQLNVKQEPVSFCWFVPICNRTQVYRFSSRIVILFTQPLISLKYCQRYQVCELVTIHLLPALAKHYQKPEGKVRTNIINHSNHIS